MKVATLEEALKWIAEKYPEKFYFAAGSKPFIEYRNNITRIDDLNSDQINEICGEIGIRIFVGWGSDFSGNYSIDCSIWEWNKDCGILQIEVDLPIETTDREAKIIGLIAWVNKQIK